LFVYFRVASGGFTVKMSFEEAKEILEKIGRLLEEMREDLKNMEEKERRKQMLKSFLKILNKSRVEYII